MHAIDTSNRARTDLKQFPMSTFAYPRLVALDVNKSILSVQLFQKSTWSTVHFASGRPTEFLVGTRSPAKTRRFSLLYDGNP